MDGGTMVVQRKLTLTVSSISAASDLEPMIGAHHRLARTPHPHASLVGIPVEARDHRPGPVMNDPAPDDVGTSET